jgi:hypothetical protein
MPEIRGSIPVFRLCPKSDIGDNESIEKVESESGHTILRRRENLHVPLLSILLPISLSQLLSSGQSENRLRLTMLMATRIPGQTLRITVPPSPTPIRIEASLPPSPLQASPTFINAANTNVVPQCNAMAMNQAITDQRVFVVKNAPPSISSPTMLGEKRINHSISPNERARGRQCVNGLLALPKSRIGACHRNNIVQSGRRIRDNENSGRIERRGRICPLTLPLPTTSMVSSPPISGCSPPAFKLTRGPAARGGWLR